MYRVIYFNPSLGYKSIDYKDDTYTSKAEEFIKSQDAFLVCIVDYYRKAILNKCDDFNSHREKIDHIIFDSKVMGLYF